MKMPVLADIKKTQEELGLALAELDRLEEMSWLDLLSIRETNSPDWRLKTRTEAWQFGRFLIAMHCYSIEAAVTNFETGPGRGGPGGGQVQGTQVQQARSQGEERQLRARVEFLTQENSELSQVRIWYDLHILSSFIFKLPIQRFIVFPFYSTIFTPESLRICTCWKWHFNPSFAEEWSDSPPVWQSQLWKGEAEKWYYGAKSNQVSCLLV